MFPDIILIINNIIHKSRRLFAELTLDAHARVTGNRTDAKTGAEIYPAASPPPLTPTDFASPREIKKTVKVTHSGRKHYDALPYSHDPL